MKSELGLEKALEQAVRTSLSILTEGVLVAPTEGVVKVSTLENSNNTKCASIYYAGPIRAAGGTAQALSVLIADVVRRELGLDPYIPTPAEIERYKEEIPLYKRAVNLQYVPSPEEIHTIVTSCPNNAKIKASWPKPAVPSSIFFEIEDLKPIAFLRCFSR